jgi:hypothetical protein
MVATWTTAQATSVGGQYVELAVLIAKHDSRFVVPKAANMYSICP